MRTVRDVYEENNRCYKATIELCTTCNWHCRHCYLSQHDNQGLPTERLLQLFKELRSLGVYDLILTGGEIFTRSDSFLLIEAARRMGFAVSLLSNASLLTEDTIRALARLQIEAFDCTIFSMDSSVHDSFVQKEGALSAALANILLLKAGGINVQVKCILTKLNWDAYKGIMAFCKEHQLRWLFTPVVYGRRDGNAAPRDLLVSEEALDEIIQNTTENNGYSYKGQTEDDYICKSARYGMSISASGDVSPCGNHPWIIGNVNDRSLQELWLDERYSYIKNLKYKDTVKCGACALKERCFNCSGVNGYDGRTILGYDERACHMAELRLKHFG